MSFIVPEPDSRADLTMADGAIIRLRRYGNSAGSRLVLCHGNGFAIDAYYPFWRLLTDDFDVVLYDQRNHGQNPRHTIERHRLDSFVSDMDEVYQGVNREFGNKPSIGIFHSISAITAIRHALEYGKRWQGLILFDPAFVPGPDLPGHELGLKFELGLVEWAKIRPDHFADPAEQAANFSGSRTLKRWVPGVYELMARSILHQDNETNKWELNCPGVAEAQIYKDNSQTHLTELVSQLPVPVKLICGDPDMPDSLSPSKVGQNIHSDTNIPYVAIKDASHLLQVENPEECAIAAISSVREFDQAETSK